MADATGTRPVSNEQIETSLQVVRDLTTPVATIMGSLGTLQRHWDALDDLARKRLIGHAAEAVGQLADFTEQLKVSEEPRTIELPE